MILRPAGSPPVSSGELGRSRPTTSPRPNPLRDGGFLASTLRHVPPADCARQPSGVGFERPLSETPDKTQRPPTARRSGERAAIHGPHDLTEWLHERGVMLSREALQKRCQAGRLGMKVGIQWSVSTDEAKAQVRDEGRK